MDVKALRKMAIQEIREGKPQQVISMEMHHESDEYGFVDDVWDDDGDSIQVHQDSRLLLEESALVRGEFPRGVSPAVAARVFRKFADMLDGRDGYDIVNLGDTCEGYTHATRLADGDVELYNLRALYRDHKQANEVHDPQDPPEEL